MGKQTIVSLVGAVILLLFSSLFIYSQVGSQGNDQVTQAEFVNTLIRALGMENQLPVAATLSDKVQLLERLGYAPLGGWNLEALLTKGDVAVVLGQVLRIDMPAGAGVDEYVQALADQGIMTAGGADLPFSPADLASSINTAAAMPGSRLGAIAPYHMPVSPVM